MASYYDEKQQRRRHELNSRRNSSQNDDRKRRNRGKTQLKIVRENNDFYPDYMEGSIQCMEDLSFCPPSSPISDDENIESLMRMPQARGTATNVNFSAGIEKNPMDQEANGVDPAKWIKVDQKLEITPVHQRHADPYSMENKCRRAMPIVDTTILHDLQKAFNNPPILQLSELIRCCQKLPYWIRTFDGQLEEAAKKFMTDFRLNEKQLLHIHRINQQVTLRSSYGVLFLQGNQFFSKTTLNRGNRRSTIKGYPMLKSNGEYEHPWETAVRVTGRYIQYRNNESEEWQGLHLGEHIKEHQHEKYLECLITGLKNTEHLRYIGLFVIRLKSDVQIRVNDYYQVEEKNNWYSIEEKVDNSIFYTIGPFLKYIREHPDFV